MNTKITFTIQGQLFPFTIEVEQSMSIEQATSHVKALAQERGFMFRGKRASVKVVSVITA